MYFFFYIAQFLSEMFKNSFETGFDHLAGS